MTKNEIFAQIAQIEQQVANYKRGQGTSLKALKAAHRKLCAAYIKAA